MITTQIGTSQTFGLAGSTIAGMIADALGGDAKDFDVEGLESEYRTVVEGLLPANLFLAGDQVYGEAGVDYDLDDITETIATAVRDLDFWAIAQRHDLGADNAQPSRTAPSENR